MSLLDGFGFIFISILGASQDPIAGLGLVSSHISFQRGALTPRDRKESLPPHQWCALNLYYRAQPSGVNALLASCAMSRSFRPKLVCAPCTSKKIRCNKLVPCDNCISPGQPELCVRETGNDGGTFTDVDAVVW